MMRSNEVKSSSPCITVSAGTDGGPEIVELL